VFDENPPSLLNKAAADTINHVKEIKDVGLAMNLWLVAMA
jgi:hypothetical protein